MNSIEKINKEIEELKIKRENHMYTIIQYIFRKIFKLLLKYDDYYNWLNLFKLAYFDSKSNNKGKFVEKLISETYRAIDNLDSPDIEIRNLSEKIYNTNMIYLRSIFKDNYDELIRLKTLHFMMSNRYKRKEKNE